MARRSKGEGSITGPRKDGRYRASLGNGRDPLTGKPDIRYIYGDTRAEVTRKLRVLTGQVANGEMLSGRSPNAAVWMREWVDIYSKIAQSTRRVYSDAIETHLVPAFGHLRVNEITPPVVQRWIKAHVEADGSAGVRARVKLALSALRGSLKAARAAGHTNINAAALIMLPTFRPSRDMQPLTPAQAKRLIAAAETHPYGVAIVLLLGSGAREGEALGLGWDRVDPNTGVIQIREQLVRVHDHRKRQPSFMALRPLKTKKSRRDLTLPAFCLPLLKAQRRAQNEARLKAGPAWVDTGRVLTTLARAGRARPGGFLGAGNLRRIFYDMLAAAKLPPIHLHDLRHSNAAILRALGKKLEDVGLLLGHANWSTTQNVYGHLMEETSRDAATRLDSIFLDTGSDTGSTMKK